MKMISMWKEYNSDVIKPAFEWFGKYPIQFGLWMLLVGGIETLIMKLLIDRCWGHSFK